MSPPWEGSMPRMPRGIEIDEEGQYHLRGQVAGPRGYYPLQEKDNAEQLIAIIQRFTGLYFCVVAALEVLGSHYHLCCRFPAFRELSREELQKLAELFYSGTYRPYRSWGKAEWARFNRRLFTVSELMRNIQQAFARWFNQRHHRKGSFWAGRFQSTDSDDLLETVYYVELNAVRAHLARLPEEWPYSSLWMRKHRQDDWLMPLVTLLDSSDPEQAERRYWASLYWKGTWPSKETDGLIPVELAEQMEKEQFPRACYLERRESFSRGLKIGSREAIAARLKSCRDQGIYRRRQHPIPCGVGRLFALRDSRRTYFRL
jgi:putative transposase